MKYFLTFLTLSALFIGCSQRRKEDPTLSSTDPLQKKGLFSLVNDVTNNVILPAYNDLNSKTLNLSQEIMTQCQDPTTMDLAKLKSALLPVIRAYHFTEAFQIGSIAQNDYSKRNKIYSWPDDNPYLIDKEIAKRQEDPNYKFITYYSSTLGLPALEYLFWDNDFLNECSECGDQAMETWNTLSEKDRKTSRCLYMKFLVGHLQGQINEVQSQWQPNAGDITLSATYQNDFKTLKSFAIKLGHSLMFFDKQVKDVRLGVPSGINYDLCGFDNCPERTEHKRSGDSIHSLLQSLKGFQAVFTSDYKGKKGYGFEEWLIQQGFRDLSDNINKALSNAIASLEKLKETTNIEILSTDITYDDCKVTTRRNRKVEVCAIYMDIKKITDLYKNEFLLATDFGRPVDQGGDTD